MGLVAPDTRGNACWLIKCNNCGHQAAWDGSNAEQTLSLAENDGWTVTRGKGPGEVVALCPECRKKQQKVTPAAIVSLMDFRQALPRR
ncbi:MAG: hypothetical protein WC518_02020 [Patescibacteria group bacterium]